MSIWSSLHADDRDDRPQLSAYTDIDSQATDSHATRIDVATATSWNDFIRILWLDTDLRWQTDTLYLTVQAARAMAADLCAAADLIEARH